ncbi:class I SAM-dependent methyltransferase [Candidatus Uabimicrobium amorphum]|uniref:Uncharacterized protein n=1 Tax=Uabimicrobium amorphum TaxID=2596890 RepID=A0A5S9F5J0_UABAM|nr:class I SAM-dependent methyltransferase [Candidatus Uabimicrobium amorphum]BBM86915.1 hypothetical protein UABAM_05317 [Candidatus Uabimicrobium amorphum]
MGLKQTIKTKYPKMFHFLKAMNQRKIYLRRKLHFLANYKKYRSYQRVSRKVFSHCKARVLQGPFRDMKYIKVAHGSVLAPKILGTYEKELYPFVEEVIAGNYKNILDIGCAEGYYAVGFAVRCPKSQVYAYDVMFKAQKMCRKLAEVNNCTNIKVKGECGWEEIAKLSNEKSFIFCDIEGAETYVFDPIKCPEITKYDFLIEMHDTAEENISDELMKRFEDTHDITIIRSQKREPDEYINFLSTDDRILALEELRGEECWGYFKRK